MILENAIVVKMKGQALKPKVKEEKQRNATHVGS
jgi:hypothetical protein